MITIKEIESKTMTEAKKMEANKSYFAFYIGRPLSYVFTIPFLYTNIKPNTITIISIVFSCIGFYWISIGKSVTERLIGLLFFFLWNLFDGVDGNIARYKNIKSENGDLLDTFGGYLAMVLIILSASNAAYFDYSNSMWKYPVFLTFAIGGISAISTLIPRLLMHRKLAKSNKSNCKLKDKENYSIPKIIALNLCDPAGFQEVILLFAILFHLLGEFTFFYGIVNVAIMIYSILNLLETTNNEINH